MINNFYILNFENELNNILEYEGLNQALTFYKIFVNENLINYYNSLKYKDYLLTTYWKIVKQIKLKETEYICEKCKNENILDVHHLTYKHRGLEFIFLDDLVCLCKECHRGVHKKNEMVSA